MEMTDLIEILHREACSCVLLSAGGKILLCRERGVSDLLRLYHESPDLLHGAVVADKVVGKGAAALMILGGIKYVHADVMSEPARSLLETYGVKAEWSTIVPGIINRSGTGFCPIENLCRTCDTPEECLPKIENFILQKNI